MEKVRINAVQRTSVETDGIRNKNAVTKVLIAEAKTKDIPLEPFSILSHFEFISHAFYGCDIIVADFFPHFSNVYIHRTSQNKYIRSPNIV